MRIFMFRLYFFKSVHFPIGILLFLFFVCVPRSSALSLDYQNLQRSYDKIKKQLVEHPSGLPIYIESFDENNSISGDVYSITSHSFSTIKNTLTDPANWCDISLLHLNIKACTFKHNKENQKITIYTGRKFYQPPEDAFVHEYIFEIVHNQSSYFKVLLTAASGPIDTRDYQIQLEAMPIKGNKAFLHFSYSYTYGLATHAAMEGYFSTLGRSKIGFSVIGQDKDKNPVYIAGTRGAIERNSVRYYLAIQAYLDTLRISEKNRFEHRIQLWYSLTDQFKKQLFELPRVEYINAKRLEYRNQTKLQDQVNQYIK